MFTIASPDPRNSDACAHCGESITQDQSVFPPRWTHYIDGATVGESIACGGRCECSWEEGPCERHGEVLAQREGASLHTADELALIFLDDMIDAEGGPAEAALSPYGLDIYREATDALQDARWLDAELSDALSELVRQVESASGLWVTWDDGYRIVRPTEDCPLTF